MSKKSFLKKKASCIAQKYTMYFKEMHAKTNSRYTYERILAIHHRDVTCNIR